MTESCEGNSLRKGAHVLLPMAHCEYLRSRYGSGEKGVDGAWWRAYKGHHVAGWAFCWFSSDKGQKHDADAKRVPEDDGSGRRLGDTFLTSSGLSELAEEAGRGVAAG